MKDHFDPLGPDPFETQRLGRATIAAFAHPGRVMTCRASMAGLLQTFVPAGTRLFLSDALRAQGIKAPQAARAAEAAAATVAAAPAAEALAILPLLPRGTLLHPEDGALLILAVAGIAETGAARRYRVTRGAAGGRTRPLCIDGLPEGFGAARAAANAAYPTGVDILLVDEARGLIAGLPRHVRLEGEET